MTSETEDADAPAPHAVMSERRVALLGGMLASLGPMSLALFTPAMPVLTGVFATTDPAIKATLSIYFAGYAGAQLVSGPLADRYGRRPVVIGFMLIYLAGCFGTLIATSIEALLWSRALQGIGAAAALVMSRAIVRDLFTGESSSRVLNFSNIILGAGPMVAPAIGGAAMMVAGWRAPFVVMLMLGLCVLAAVQFRMAETRPATGMGPEGTAEGYLSILRNPYFFWSSATISAGVAAFYAQSTVMSFIVMGQLGYTSAGFGLVMLLVSGGYFLGAVAVRFLIPRFGATRLVPAGLSILVTASFVLAALNLGGTPSVAAVAVPMAVMVFGNALVLPGMYTACLAPFAASAGTASALSGFMTMGLGLIVSLLIALVPDPATGLALTEPLVAITAGLSYLMWRRQRL